MATHKVKQGQTLIDVALINYGNAEALSDITQANNLSLTSDITAGSELILPVLPVDTQSLKVIRHFSDNNLSPATN